MKISRKIIGIVAALTVFATQFAPAMAADPEGTGTGNIIDYKTDTVLVPTTFKFAINPRKYDIIDHYSDDTAGSYDAAEVYYKIDASGAMVKDTSIVDATSYAGAKTATNTVYKGETSDDQIVSLGYAIVSNASEDKRVDVTFKISYTADNTKTAIDFVDTALKATSKKQKIGTDDGLAEDGEMKMYFAVASANATAPKMFSYFPTYEKLAAAGTYANTTKYYTLKAADIALEESTTITNQTTLDAAFAAGDVFTKTGTAISPYTVASELSEVDLTAATTGLRAFVDKGTANKAETTMGFKLGKATYDARTGSKFDLSSSSSGILGKLKRDTVGGVAGFTFTGALNTGADWSKAETGNMTVTAVYKFSTATDADTTISGTSGQITIGPEIAGSTVFTLDAANTPVVVKVDNLGTDTIKEVTFNGSALSSTNASLNSSKDTVTFATAYLKYLDAAGSPYTFTIVTENGVELTVKIVREAAGG